MDREEAQAAGSAVAMRTVAPTKDHRIQGPSVTAGGESYRSSAVQQRLRTRRCKALLMNFREFNHPGIQVAQPQKLPKALKAWLRGGGDKYGSYP
eukprot:9480447-Pyramimonas_sp.AAC.2